MTQRDFCLFRRYFFEEGLKLRALQLSVPFVNGLPQRFHETSTRRASADFPACIIIPRFNAIQQLKTSLNPVLASPALSRPPHPPGRNRGFRQSSAEKLHQKPLPLGEPVVPKPAHPFALLFLPNRSSRLHRRPPPRRQVNPPHAAVGGIRDPFDVAQGLQFGDGLMGSLLANFHPLGQLTQRPVATHEVLKHKTMGKPKVLKALGVQRRQHAVLKRKSREQRQVADI